MPKSIKKQADALLQQVPVEQRQERWREKYIYPLEEMFRSAGVFFTMNVFDQDRVLEDIAKRTGELTGEVSMAQRMARFVSPEAAELYRTMLHAPYPWA